jgi:uncharacterized protein (TIGR02284 family)
MENTKIVSVLNNLIETSRDGATGFHTCAEGAKDPMLKAYFGTRAQSCNDAIRELNIEVIHHGGQPAEYGSAEGVLRRAWLNVRTAVTSNDDLAVLEECEKAEDSARDSYREALKELLPEHVRVLIQKQYEGTKANHDRVRKLRDERKLAAATTAA